LGVVANLVPFGHNIQGVRFSQGSKNQKQGIGFYTANYLNRMDMDVNILHTPQIPIVSTLMYDVSGYHKHPSGQNLTIAVLSYEGYNMEDAIILNEGSINRGLCRSTYYRPAIAEELRLPLDIVAAPNHLFVRWDDGKNVFNWETVDIFTSKEKIIEDSKYISEFNIHEKSILNGVYLKNLTSEELESIAFDLNGITKLSLKDFKGAIDDFNMSIELDPKSPNSYSNRGFTKIYFNDLEGEAISLFGKDYVFAENDLSKDKLILLDSSNSIFD